MKRRALIQMFGATALLVGVPREAKASVSVDAYFVSAFDRVVAPICTHLSRPATLERADTSPYWYTTTDADSGLTRVSYGHGMTVPASDYEAIHESGHAFAALLGQRYPDWIKDFLSYHGASLPEDDLRLAEIFAEHFAAGLGMEPYLGYPAYKGLVPFRSAEDTRAWIIEANSEVGPIPPVTGAKYAGESADLSQVFWLYPDGSVHRG